MMYVVKTSSARRTQHSIKMSCNVPMLWAVQKISRSIPAAVYPAVA